MTSIVYRDANVRSLTDLRNAIEGIEQLARDQGIDPERIVLWRNFSLTLRETDRGYDLRVS